MDGNFERLDALLGAVTSRNLFLSIPDSEELRRLEIKSEIKMKIRARAEAPK